LETKVAAGAFSALTLKKRRAALKLLRQNCGQFSLDMPRANVVALRDNMAATPAAADDLVGAIRSMYRWARELGICDVNPATGVARIDRGKGGATPWTLDDLNAYRRVHPPGTPAHLTLTLFMFTACRISDAVVLGRKNEFVRDGVRGLGWQPAKRGSAYVEIPMLAPLHRATRAAPVVGPTYLMTGAGRPFKSPEGLRNRFKKWCHSAGLGHLSSHGIRKAAGHLLARQGCSQYQIMAIHGHTQARTSEVYTRGVERWRLASDAMRAMQAMQW
jgi:integrase